MSERNDLRQPEQSEAQRPSPRPRRKRRPSLGGYLIILFAVAFLLLLMAYFQQQRLKDQATSDALKQSSSAVQSIQSLMDESKALREENEDLKAQIAGLKDTLDSMTDMYETESAARSQQDAAVAAMDYFWQIDEAYVRQRYTLCKQLIQELKSMGYEDSLPTTKATGNDRFCPMDRYKEIYDALY